MPRKKKPARPRGGSSVMTGRRWRKNKIDDFPTPPWATRAAIEEALFKHLGVRRLGVVADPCCGREIMSDVIREYAQSVIASDAYDYGRDTPVRDYRLARKVPHVDWTFTNPPFAYALEMTLRALRTSRRGVVIFERVQWLEGVDRYEQLFAKHPPTLVAVYVERVPMVQGRWDPDISTATCYMLAIWMRGRKGEWMPPRPLFWIPPGQKKRLSHAGDRARFATRRRRPRRPRRIALTAAKPARDRSRRPTE